MSAAQSLHQLARDFGRAAVAIQADAAVAVTDAASAVEIRAHALDVGTGVVVLRPAPSTAVVVATMPHGVYAGTSGASVVPADTGQLAGELAGQLLTDGLNLILGRRR